MLGGRVRFKKFRAGNFIHAIRVPHDDARPQPLAMVASMVRPDPSSSINVNDVHISLGHTNDAIACETAKQMGMKVMDSSGYYDVCGEAKAIRQAEGDQARRSQEDEGQVGEATAASLHRPYGAAPTVPCAFRRGDANAGGRSSNGYGSGGSGTCCGNGDRQWSLPRCVGKRGGRCACVCSCSGVNGDRPWSLPRCVGEGGGWCACVCSCSGSIDGGHFDGCGGGGVSGDSAGWGEGDDGSARWCVPHAPGGPDNCAS